MKDIQLQFSGREKEIIDLLTLVADRLGLESYLVGGYVRDKILGRPVKDLDVVCVGSGIELAQAMADSFDPKLNVTVFKNFGTAMLKIDDWEVEFVGARKESYSRNSRKPFVEAGTLEDDQKRRDFTINALAIALNSDNFGQIIDPFEGLKDLEEQIIRTPLEPEATFSDDPLRMMRAIRFATQLQFTIEETTYNGIAANKNRLDIISSERIADELNKVMLSPKPSVGFKLLFNTGLLDKILPELTALQGVETRDGKGHKDNFYHTLQVLDNLANNSDDLWLRWAALLHDVGKAPTKRFDKKAGWTFHGHEVVGAKMVKQIFKRLRLPMNEKMKYVQKLVNLHLRPISLTNENVTDSAIRRLLFDAGDDIDDLMMLCEADITSKNKHKVRKYLLNFEMVRQKLQEVEEKDHLRNWQPPVTGEDIMQAFNLKPSQEVGVIKNAIKEAILEGKIRNNREDAYKFMLSTGEDMGLKPAPDSTNQKS